MESKKSVGMEEFSTEGLMPKQIRTPAASSSSYGNPCDMVERAISAVLKCLGLGPFCWPFSKRDEDTNKHQNVSFDPPPSTEAAHDPPSVLERGLKASEDVAARSLTVRLIRKPKAPPISSGGGPQNN